MDKLKTPESTLAEIKAITEPESAVNSAVTALENCYQSAGRQYINSEIFDLFTSLWNVS